MKTKRFFQENNIPFEAVAYDLADLEERERIREEVAESGTSLSFPWIRINDEIVIGWQPERFRELLEL
jgi:glutaredoxin